MTVKEIRKDLKPEKPLSRERLYFYFRKFKIKPLSRTRLKPQQYPDNTAMVIRRKLGLGKGKATVSGLHKR